MPALQLRGFLIGLLSLVAMLVASAGPSRVVHAQAGAKSTATPAGAVKPTAAKPTAVNPTGAKPAAVKRTTPKPTAAKPSAVKPTIAVLYFDYSGNDEEMGFLRKGMAQMLVTDLSASEDLQIVERIDLEAVLKELKLGTSNKIDQSSRNRIGKLLGARYLVTGGYFQFRNSLRVDAKIIDVERGTTTSVGVQASPDDFMKLEAQLATKLEAALLAAQKRKATAQVSKPRVKTARSAAKKTPKVAARTVARYGRALDALDQGKTQVATTELETVTREAPHFKPAADDLRILLR